MAVQGACLTHGDTLTSAAAWWSISHSVTPALSADSEGGATIATHTPDEGGVLLKALSKKTLHVAMYLSLLKAHTANANTHLEHTYCNTPVQILQ